MRTKTVFFLVAAILFFSPALWAVTPAPLTARLELLDVSEGDHIAVRLKLILKNESDTPVELLRWGTPFEGDFTSDLFKVTVNGEAVPYIGKLVKRLPPTDADFMTIPGGEERSEIVNLEEGYKLYLPGRYEVQLFESALQMKTDSQQMKVAAVTSNGVEFELLHGIDEAAAMPAIAQYKCSDAQFNVIVAAHSSAKDLVTVATQDLRNAPESRRSQAERYLEWFGVYDAARYNQVTTNLDKVRDVLFNQTVTVECPRCPGTFAYVYPSRPYTVYFCDRFFSAPQTGTDSQAGTIIHELTHFNVVASTDDIVYGQSACRDLALSNPNEAIRNADSHEYFAENTPPLSMPAAGSDSDDSGCFIESLK